MLRERLFHPFHFLFAQEDGQELIAALPNLTPDFGKRNFLAEIRKGPAPGFGVEVDGVNQRPIHVVTESLRRETIKAGRPLPISLDEFTLDRGQRAIGGWEIDGGS